MEAGSSVGFALDPDASAVRLDDLLDDGEADSGAPSTVLAGTDALEDLEDTVVVGEIDSPTSAVTVIAWPGDGATGTCPTELMIGPWSAADAALGRPGVGWVK